MNNLKESIYNQIDYSSKASIYASKLKLESVLSSSAVLDDETKEYYKEAIEELNNIIKYEISITNEGISIGNIINNILHEGPVIKSNGILIGCYYSKTRAKYANAAYFKVYNAEKKTSAKYVARIKFTSPEFVIHPNDTEGKISWKMTNNEIDNLINVLDLKIEGKTVYEKLCDELYNVAEIRVSPNQRPDYNLLKK